MSLLVARRGAIASRRMVATDAYASAVLADSPVGFWRFGEDSGTTAADSSGNSNDGTYENSPTLDIAGPVDRAIRVDNSALSSPNRQHVSAHGIASIFNASDWAMEIWMRSTDSGFIGCPCAAGHSSTSDAYVHTANGATLTGSDADDLTGRYRNNSDAGDIVGPYSTGNLTGGGWHHIVLTRGGTIMRLIYDGVERDTSSSSRTVGLDRLTAGLLISAGTQSFSNGEYELAEWAVYDAELSETRAKAHFDAA